MNFQVNMVDLLHGRSSKPLNEMSKKFEHESIFCKPNSPGLQMYSPKFSETQVYSSKYRIRNDQALAVGANVIMSPPKSLIQKSASNDSKENSQNPILFQ